MVKEVEFMQELDKITHADFKEMKKQLGLTNALIASEIGLTTDSVKNQTAPAKELPTWAKSMILIWQRLK